MTEDVIEPARLYIGADNKKIINRSTSALLSRLQPEVIEWLNTMIGITAPSIDYFASDDNVKWFFVPAETYNRTHERRYYILLFKNPKDAMAFKLAWA